MNLRCRRVLTLSLSWDHERFKPSSRYQFDRTLLLLDCFSPQYTRTLHMQRSERLLTIERSCRETSIYIGSYIPFFLILCLCIIRLLALLLILDSDVPSRCRWLVHLPNWCNVKCVRKRKVTIYRVSLWYVPLFEKILKPIILSEFLKLCFIESKSNRRRLWIFQIFRTIGSWFFRTSEKKYRI